MQYGLGMISSPQDARDFSLQRAVAYTAAPIVNRVVLFLPEPVDQGDTSTCMAVTLAGILEAIELKQRGIRLPISAKFIYGNRAETDHQGEGMIPREAFAQATRFGAPRASLLPGLSDYPTAKSGITGALDGEGLPNRIRGYVRLSGLQDINDYFVLFEVPCMLGIMVYESFLQTGADGIVPAPFGKLLGGHAMRCIGIFNGRVILQNSWGAKWGKNGLCYLDLSQHTAWESWGALPEDSRLLIQRTQDILLTLGSKTMWVDGKRVEMDVAPFAQNNRTYVPLAFIAQALGAKVKWVPQGGMVFLQWAGEQEAKDVLQGSK